MSHTFKEIPLTKDEVLACSYLEWQPLLHNYTYEADIIKPLPRAFLDYLAADSIKLPGTVLTNTTSENENSDSSDNESPAITTTDDFKKVHDRIVTILRKHDVIPKLNWSLPKDAKWIATGNTMRCHVPDDIYLLLNASDHIADDLDLPFNEVRGLEIEDGDKSHNSDNVAYELVLKKWIDINPALEFRIFVKDRHVVGVSQRDLNNYEFLHEIKHDIKSVIDKFIEHSDILHNFPISNFIIDVYVPRTLTEVKVIDVNPFSRKSDPLLFTWNEILTDTVNNYELRLINKNNLGRFATKEFSESQVPLEVISASTNGGADLAEFAKEWEKMQRKEVQE